MRTRDARGRFAETLAALYLRLCGYRILARRFATRVGEIDIVAARRDLVVFVEVKHRASRAEALESVLPAQRARIERAASLFLALHPRLASARVRFDVVAFAPRRLPVHLRDAWRPGNGGAA